MTRHGKKYRTAKEKIETDKKYSLDDALKLLTENSYANFDETVEVTFNLGVDPKHADQMVRGTVSLPHGTGKDVRVVVFATGEKEKEAIEAGADHVGGKDLVEKISKGWLEFDSAVSTREMMSVVGKLGKILGPRGLMPNPKMGTVTEDIGKLVKQLKAGRLEFKVDKGGNLHIGAGKVSFGAEKLRENIHSLLDAIIKARPDGSKGTYLKKCYLSTTIGPSIRLDTTSFFGKG